MEGGEAGALVDARSGITSRHEMVGVIVGPEPSEANESEAKEPEAEEPEAESAAP